MEEEILTLLEQCNALSNKAKTLRTLLSSSSLTEWQVRGCKNLLGELNLKLDNIHETLTRPVQKKKT